MNTEFSTLRALRTALDAKEVSVKEVTESYLSRIEGTQEALNSFISVTAEHARKQAEHAQREIDAGNSGPLTGIPYGAKDVFCTPGIRTTAASNILKDYIPPYESSLLSESHHDAVLLGKLNLDEFAMGTTGEYSAFGATKNPYDLGRVAGGSSSGPAAAVASGQVPFAWGTDTGGSIRLPAAFTHTVGYKPTYGTFSRYGVIAMASSLDTVGTFTRNVEDAAYLVEHCAALDTLDTTMRTDRSFRENLTERIQQSAPTSFRYGVPKEFLEAEGMDPAVKEAFEQALNRLRATGAEILEVSMPVSLYGINAYYVLTPSEVSSNMARYDGMQFGTRAEGGVLQEVIHQTREEGFGQEVKRRILMGTFYLSHGFSEKWYHRASQVRTKIIEEFHQTFAQVDVLLCPPAPSTAFEIGATMNDPLTMWLADLFTVPMNLAGVPAVSIPGYQANGLPTGVQCIAAHGRDDIALSAAWTIEQVLQTEAPHLQV